MQASAPHAPVVPAGEGFPDHGDPLVLQKSVVRGEAVEELILRPHRTVEDAEALAKALGIVQQRQAAVLLFSIENITKTIVLDFE